MKLSFLVAASLWRRDVVRFVRQKSRVVGGLLTPIVFWLLIGFGIGESFRPPGWARPVTYAEYFFPGTLLLIVLFTAVFSTVSVIEDRREGFLQGVLISPAPTAAIVAAKVAGGATLAFGHGLVFLLLAPLSGLKLTAAGLVQTLVFLALASVLMTLLGLLVAWPMESTQGFHAVMNLFLIPLWLLSGALFPPDGAAVSVRVAMRLNPVHYLYLGLQRGLLPDGSTIAEWHLGLVSLAAIAGLAIVVTWIAERGRSR